MRVNVIKLYAITLPSHLVWLLVVGIVLRVAGLQFSQHVASSSEFSSSLFFIPCVALVEEMMFRWVPMTLLSLALIVLTKLKIINTEKRDTIEIYGIYAVVIGISIWFGMLHGNVFNILLQGVSSLIFFMFYLRTYFRRKQENPKISYQMRPLLASTIYHTVSNAVMIII